MAPPPQQEDGPLPDAERDGDRVVVANGHGGHGREELDESLDAEVRDLELIEHGGEEEDDVVYDEDVNAAERMVEEFGGFDPPLYIQRFVPDNPFLLCTKGIFMYLKWKDATQ